MRQALRLFESVSKRPCPPRGAAGFGSSYPRRPVDWHLDSQRSRSQWPPPIWPMTS